jgi:hypothetical protein
VLPADLVHVGFSLGVLAAQMLAQTRPGARGAVLLHSCLPVSEFGDSWPDAVPVQVHGMDADELFVAEGDLDAARALVASAADGELFLYPGDAHLFTDRSLPAYEPVAADLLAERVLAFLSRVGGLPGGRRSGTDLCRARRAAGRSGAAEGPGSSGAGDAGRGRRGRRRSAAEGRRSSRRWSPSSAAARCAPCRRSRSAVGRSWPTSLPTPSRPGPTTTSRR